MNTDASAFDHARHLSEPTTRPIAGLPGRLPALLLMKLLRDAETADVPFMAALTGALRRCTSLVLPATWRSARLALHPASAAKNGTSAIYASLRNEYEITWTFLVALTELLSEGLSRQKTAAKSLLILAGSGHARHRALPVDSVGPHSDTFNRGFKVEQFTDSAR